MLTATYSFIALTAEQDKARNMLSRLQEYVQSAWHSLQGYDAVEAALQKLMRFDNFCRQRKLECYVVPVLQRVSDEAGKVVAEFERLAQRASDLLRAVQAALALRAELRKEQLGELWHQLNHYCDRVRIQLEREERELLPLARRVLSVEDWFAIAAQFLSADPQGDPRSGRRRQVTRQRTTSLSPLTVN